MPTVDIVPTTCRWSFFYAPGHGTMNLPLFATFRHQTFAFVCGAEVTYNFWVACHSFIHHATFGWANHAAPPPTTPTTRFTPAPNPSGRLRGTAVRLAPSALTPATRYPHCWALHTTAPPAFGSIWTGGLKTPADTQEERLGGAGVGAIPTCRTRWAGQCDILHFPAHPIRTDQAGTGPTLTALAGTGHGWDICGPFTCLPSHLPSIPTTRCTGVWTPLHTASACPRHTAHATTSRDVVCCISIWTWRAHATTRHAAPAPSASTGPSTGGFNHIADYQG